MHVNDHTVPPDAQTKHLGASFFPLQPWRSAGLSSRGIFPRASFQTPCFISGPLPDFLSCSPCPPDPECSGQPLLPRAPLATSPGSEGRAALGSSSDLCTNSPHPTSQAPGGWFCKCVRRYPWGRGPWTLGCPPPRGLRASPGAGPRGPVPARSSRAAAGPCERAASAFLAGEAGLCERVSASAKLAETTSQQWKSTNVL